MNAIKRIVLWGTAALLALNCLGCNLLRIPTPVAWSLTGTPRPAGGTPAPSPVEFVGRTPPPIVRATTPSPARPSPQNQNTSPWLVYSRAGDKSPASLLAIQTGSGATGAEPVRIELPDPLLTAADLRTGASPTEALLAVRTGPGATPGKGMALRLVDLGKRSAREISPLLSPALEKQLETAGTGRLSEAIAAVTDENGLSWSPDGRYLAFIAAVDGPSADLYVYDVKTGQNHRLTSGTRQAATPTWSPNSNWIITQEVDAFGAEGNWRVTAVWVEAVDGSEIHRLYTPPETSGGERFLGWTGPDTLVVATWTLGGIQNVREIPLNTRWLTPIYRGSTATLAFDPVSRWLYFTQNETSAKAPVYATEDPALTSTPAPAAPPMLLPGLYRLAPIQDARAELVLAGEWRQVSWQSRAGLFAAQGFQGTLLISPDGRERLIKGESNAVPSPNGQWIAGWGGQDSGHSDGVRLYQPDGTLLQAVTSQPVQLLVWDPDSKGVYFQSGSTLFRASFPNPEPQPVDTEVLELGLGIVPRK